MLNDGVSVTGLPGHGPGQVIGASVHRPTAFFLPALRGGGAERVVVNLIQGMTERGVRVDLVLSAATGVYLDQLPSAVRVIDLRSKRLLWSLAPLARYLRRERPRVLISSMNHANVIALCAAKLARRHTPVVVTVHNTMSVSSRQLGRIGAAFRTHLPRIFYPWASSVVAVSQGAADDLSRTSGVPRERIKVVYNPVITPALTIVAQQTPDHPWLAPGEPPVILGVGRLAAQKDFPTLVRAFAEVRRQQMARLIILGEGNDRRALEALGHELGVHSDMALPGFRDKAMAYMARSAVFVLSSAWEGLPTVLIEALAAGTRVVSTDCPSGPREILRQGELGALVPVGDYKQLALAILDVLGRPAAPPRPEALAQFTRDAAVDSYLRLIESA